MDRPGPTPNSRLAGSDWGQARLSSFPAGPGEACDREPHLTRRAPSVTRPPPGSRTDKRETPPVPLRGPRPLFHGWVDRVLFPRGAKNHGVGPALGASRGRPAPREAGGGWPRHLWAPAPGSGHVGDAATQASETRYPGPYPHPCCLFCKTNFPPNDPCFGNRENWC